MQLRVLNESYRHEAVPSLVYPSHKMSYVPAQRYDLVHEDMEQSHEPKGSGRGSEWSQFVLARVRSPWNRRERLRLA